MTERGALFVGILLVVSLLSVVAAAASEAASSDRDGGRIPGAPGEPPAADDGSGLADETSACESCGDPLVDVEVEDDARARHVAISGTGNATSTLVAASLAGHADGCEQSWTNVCSGFLGVSVLGDARGAYAVSAFGDAYGAFAFTPFGYCENTYEFYNFTTEEYYTVERRARCVDVVVSEPADGYYAAVSATGDARGPVAFSGTGRSTTAPTCAGYALPFFGSVTCASDGGYVTASGMGPADGNHSYVGASGTGAAEGGIVAVSALGPARHNPNSTAGPAISLTGPASSCNYGNVFCAAASVLGDARGEIAASIFGDAEGNVAVSVFGQASGDTAVSVCEIAPPSCISQPLVSTSVLPSQKAPDFGREPVLGELVGAAEVTL